jgi:hypothetical protein
LEGIVTQPLILGSSPVCGERGAEATAVAAAGRGTSNRSNKRRSVTRTCKNQPEWKKEKLSKASVVQR